MENPELNDLRTQINHIDEQLLQLIVQRFDVVREVGRVKQTAHLPIKDAAREQAVLNRLKAQGEDEALQPALQAIFQTMMDEAKKLE